MAINNVDAIRPSNFVIGTEARAFPDFYLYTSESYKKIFNFASQFTEAFSKESTWAINDKDSDRDIVCQLDSNGFATIFRIDYGDVQRIRTWMFQIYRLAHHCTLSNIIRPINGWLSNVIDKFHAQLNRPNLYARLPNYSGIRQISEVEISVKGSTKRFQIDLQKSMQNLQRLSSLVKYQAIALQDSRTLWHRAIILDAEANLSNVCVYFVDIGHKERILINNIYELPIEFESKPAFSIPCCLYNVCPIDGNERSIWKLDDKVYDEFIRLMVNTVNCTVCSK
ncbi:unnamed protein product [Rotaria sordida]|uniref:Tudor domain-containing protein n=2 Tax=Rotaria sordida TaxID=392033 RepID=A0A814HHF3_9BILA|nr:unnamed protein product [Rotaria sordida]